MRVMVSYRDKRFMAFAKGGSVRGFEAVRQQAERQLTIREAATACDDLRALPANRLEAVTRSPIHPGEVAALPR